MVSYTCHAGMREAAGPIVIDGELVGYVMLGQFRSEVAPAVSVYDGQWRKEEGGEALQKAYEQTPVFPENKIDPLLAMFRQLLEFIISSHLIRHKDYDLIAPIIDQIREHPERPVSLVRAADMIGRSPSTVSRLFRKITGQSFKQYEIGIRIDVAAKLLRSHLGCPVGDIARSVGIEDPFYFSRLFHKRLGCSPSLYRKRNKE